MKKKIQLRSIIILFTTIVLCVTTLCVLSAQTAVSDEKAAKKYAAHTAAVYKLEELGAERLTEIKNAAEKYGARLKESDLPADTSYENGTVTAVIPLGTQRLAITAVIGIKEDGTAEVILTGWKNYAVREESDDFELFGS